MAHEITATDGLVLSKTAAWHGLGTIVTESPTVGDALTLAKLDWNVSQLPLSATSLAVPGQPRRIMVESHVANVRDDTGEVLGVVGNGWQILQNDELGAFAEAIADNSDGLRVETAGSIMGGKKVWFLLRGDSFEIDGTKADAIEPFILLSNGFDGKTSIRATPTTVRVVCSNTLHAVIPRSDSQGGFRAKRACFVARHSGSIADKIIEAKSALSMYLRGIDETRGAMNHLAGRDVNQAAVKQFFLEAYSTDFGIIPANPKNKAEHGQRTRAQSAFMSFAKRFDTERPIAGATYWNAFNAYSGWLQHDRPTRGKTTAEQSENALASNVFGTNAERTERAFVAAMTLSS